MGFNKLFAMLGGKPVIAHSIDAFARTKSVDEIIVVAHPGRLPEVRELLNRHKVPKLKSVVAGGNRRQDSVRKGLEALGAAAEFVAIHDAARPLIQPEQIERIYESARLHGAAAAATPVTDTLKRADDNHFVCGGVEREGLYAMQTPQIFARDLLEKAYRVVAAQKLSVTDEVSAVDMLPARVLLVPDNEFNLKITYPGDLPVAELLLNRAGPNEVGKVAPTAKV